MNHLKRTLLLLIPVIAVIAVAVVAVGASAGRDDRLYVGINLHFTGPDTTAGTFVMSGAVEEAGTTQVDASLARTDREHRHGAVVRRPDLRRSEGDDRHALRGEGLPAFESPPGWTRADRNRLRNGRVRESERARKLSDRRRRSVESADRHLRGQRQRLKSRSAADRLGHTDGGAPFLRTYRLR